MHRKKKNGEPQRSSWKYRERRRMVNPRDLAGNAEKEEQGLTMPSTPVNTFSSVA